MATTGAEYLQPLRAAEQGAAQQATQAHGGTPPPGSLNIDINSGVAGLGSTRLWEDDRARTALFINLACVAERVDEQLLPSLYSFVGHAFSASPSQLGVLTFARAVVQALASPLAGLLGHHVDRVGVICCGAILWGAMCLGFASTRSVAQGLFFWAVNGIGLALLVPAAQSITADYYTHSRGRAFGMLHFTGASGAVLCTLYATNVGGARPLGMEGWRFAFGSVALLSWIIGTCTFMFAVDPRHTRNMQYRVEQYTSASMHCSRWAASLHELGSVLCVPSFLIIILQGILGTTPWVALVYLTLYFQLANMSNVQASLLMAVFLAANAVGGLIGGVLGDLAARRWPNHGRIFVCQFSVGVGVPLSALLFKGLPLGASAGVVALYAAMLATMGLTISWAAPACNNPIFAEIVPQQLRNLIYAYDRGFEGAIAALGAPLVGWLAEAAFGFSGIAEVSSDVNDNRRKAQSLSSALLVFTALPWTLCTLSYTGLHFTYPRDRKRAAQQAAAARATALAAAVESVELMAAAEPAGPVASGWEPRKADDRDG